MQRATQMEQQTPTPYATNADFCRIFSNEMNSLYLLSFLLTADDAVSEQCFVRGLEDSISGNPVFKEWAHSWARRAIIQTAIRRIGPRPQSVHRSSGFALDVGNSQVIEKAAVAAVVELPAFERFVFVLSVLERYSDQECSLLLNCTRREVVVARIQSRSNPENPWSWPARNRRSLNSPACHRMTIAYLFTIRNRFGTQPTSPRGYIASD
jgi:hypothetical protein